MVPLQTKLLNKLLIKRESTELQKA